MINTIKNLKEVINSLPDDTLVKAYVGGNGDLVDVSYWLITEETLTDEEKKDGYPNGVIPIFVVDADD